MNTMQNIDGRYLYFAFLAGANKLIKNLNELNRINVYPVADKDTGSNMASTMRSVMDRISPNVSYKFMVDQIAEAAQVGARGNSGIIMAQFLYGLSSETSEKKSISFLEFVESVQSSIPYIYESIGTPVEGTMLTVIKDWSEFLYSKRKQLEQFKQVLNESMQVLETSLKRTTDQLAVLKKHNIVDAGAKGFVVFIEGVMDFVNHGIIDRIKSPNFIPSASAAIDHLEDINYRYCTEAILKNSSIALKEIKEILNKNGDSIVITGGKNSCRVHVHTNNPSELFHQLENFATINSPKVDDMLRQSEISKNQKWKIGIVSDSTCDLPQKIIDSYQVNIMPLHLSFGDSQYLDGITLKAREFYELLDKSEHFPKTSQINEYSFLNTYSQMAQNYDAIISIHLSEKFSGTFRSAQKAAERVQKELNIPIHVINSRNVSGGLGLAVLRIAKAIEEGENIDAILSQVDSWLNKTKIFVSVKSLTAMIKGGRVPPAVGKIAMFLRINPIVSLNELGESKLFGQAIGQKANINKVIKHVMNLKKDQKIWNYIILHANNHEVAKKYGDRLNVLLGKAPVEIINISPVIGMNAGKGTVAVALQFE
ncbi:DegV family protein [Marinifilum fragile]|uniref:DegV family protein n=1 Tax=Marinifilum fragile TaxID=570161 RepID=UPI0006CFE6FE|nr:DegV family protein [Marinifilum fragile]